MINLLTRSPQKITNGIMVFSGIYDEGLGKIIFPSGNINSFTYKTVLKFYLDDWIEYPSKYFPQEGTRSHSSKLSKNMIKFLFKDKYNPTWDNGQNIDDEFMPRLPPNSPDL